MRFSVDPWDPSYGASLEGGDLDPSSADVVLDLELPADQWRPLDPPSDVELPDVVLFVDGVRRVEARVWIEGDDGRVDPGICASYAAGVVRCDGKATITDVLVERGVFSASPAAADIETKCGAFPARMAAGSTPEQLSLALQERMTQAEVVVAERSRNGDSALIVVDGPLRGRQHLVGAIGYVKTHHVSYLPNGQGAVVGQLLPGQRTPVFTMRTAWSRHSWYLRLPGPVGSPWAGVVRCECSADVAPTEVIALANMSAALLVKYASDPHKEPRAPQNLYPVSGLERELRRRLGDSELIYRGLRSSAARAEAVGAPIR